MVHQCFKAGREDRKPRLILRPVEQESQRWPANTTLAPTHAGAGHQFCMPRIPFRAQGTEWHIFAPTNDRLRIGEGTKLGPQRELILKERSKTPASSG